jgi:3-isopropylmalate dehydrogenase
VPDDFRQATEKANSKMRRFSNTPANEIAISLRIITQRASRNIVADAFEYARKNGKPSVTVVEKPNVLRETSGLFVRAARAVAKDYPDIQFFEANIDAMCMWLIKNPQDYSVLVTSNMFGDIISDLAAQLVGGLGFASSGNIGDNYAVFEPTHGSAPKYAGMYKVNPTATLLTVKLMLDWLGETELAERLENAIAAVIREGKVRTYDMGGKNTTLEMGKAVADKM